MRLTLAFIGAALLCGIVLCAYRRGWIIIAYPSPILKQPSPVKCKKEGVVYWYHANNWQQETVPIRGSEDKVVILYQIVNRWLEILEDEHVSEAHVSLGSVILTPTESTAYLSFDSSPLPQHISAYAKLCIIESLFKTIRENNSSVQEIYILMHHQPLPDAHLDFAHAWPIRGFINE